MSMLSTPAEQARRSSEAVREKLVGSRTDTTGVIFKVLLIAALSIAVATLVVLLVDVISGGWGVLTTRPWDFLTSKMMSSAENSGISQGIRGTFWIAVFVIVFAFPIGIGAAVYLEEFAPPSRLTRFIDLNVRNLAGVPSVVYGILGLTIFVQALGGITGPDSHGRSVISGGSILAILVLPIVIITAAEAIRAVPSAIKDAAFGVGATHWEVVRHHVLPYAAPGIFTGTVLSLARALGEAAPLILVGATTGYLTGGDSYRLSALGDQFTALPIIITEWTGRFQPGFKTELAPAAIVVLLTIVVGANTVAVLLRNRFEKRRG